MSTVTAPSYRPLRAAQDAATMLGRTLRHTMRSPDAMIMTIAIPIIILLMFVYVFGGAMRVSENYIDYVVPGIILLCAGFGSATTAVSISTDMRDGIIDRFRAMPVSRSAVLTGHVVESVLRNLLTTGLVILVAIAMGFRPTGNPLSWLGVLAMLTLFVIALSWIAVALGLLAPNPEAANGFSFTFMFLPYVSSAFVPPDTMPEGLRWFAQNQPVTPVTETVRGLLLGTPVGHHAVLAVAWWSGIAIVGFLLSTWMFRQRTKD